MTGAEVSGAEVTGDVAFAVRATPLLRVFNTAGALAALRRRPV